MVMLGQELESVQLGFLETNVTFGSSKSSNDNMHERKKWKSVVTPGCLFVFV